MPDRAERVPAADAIAFECKVNEEDRYILQSDYDVPISDSTRERNLASQKMGILSFASFSRQKP